MDDAPRLSAVVLYLGPAPWYAAALVAGAGVLGAWLASARAIGRFGGITGGIIGAAIEVSLATALVAAQICGAVPPTY